MPKPTTAQLKLMTVAHRNGGCVPAGSFAYYGVFVPYRGTDDITTVLTAAAKSRQPGVAEQLLTGSLTHLQLLMVGGFLGVDRDQDDGCGALAERYAAAIRNGRIELGTRADGITPTYITPATLTACIGHGWLDTKWRLTAAGRAAGQAADVHAFRPVYDLTWRDDCYIRAVQINAAAPHMGGAADQLIAEAWDEALEEHADRFPDDLTVGPAVFVLMEEATPKTLSDVDHAGSRATVDRVATGVRVDWVGPYAVPAMTGAGKSNLLPYILAGLTWSTPYEAAAAASLDDSLIRRLTPGVHCDALDANVEYVTRVVDRLVDLLPADDNTSMLRTDPRGEGYRLRLTLARRSATDETARKALKLLELAFNAFAAGRPDGGRLLDRAAGKVGVRPPQPHCACK